MNPDLDKNDFFFVQVLKRKKENPGLKGDSKVIRSYYVRDLDSVKDSIIKTCRENNARAYIRLQKRNWEKINLQIVSQLSSELASGLIKPSYNVIESIAGKYSSDERKYWIIDVDDPMLLQECFDQLDDINLKSKNREQGFIYLVIPTVNGFHLITSPFNPNDFTVENVEIKKEGMTLLYYDRT